jgi:hypothetical protein
MSQALARVLILGGGFAGLAAARYFERHLPKDVGRISPDKGLDRAIAIAQRAGLPLKVAERMPLANAKDAATQVDCEYYRGVIEPLVSTDWGVSREACRAEAVRRFSPQAMCDDGTLQLLRAASPLGSLARLSKEGQDAGRS